MFIELKGYSIVEGHPQWLVPCSLCGGIHAHGAGPGPRVPHCPHPRKEGVAYTLVYGGQAPEELIVKKCGRYWRRNAREAAKSHQKYLAMCRIQQNKPK